MNFPIHSDTKSMGLSIVYFKGSQVNFSKYDVFLSLKVVLILANSADPDFIWVFTVCQHTFQGVSSIQRVERDNETR